MIDGRQRVVQIVGQHGQARRRGDGRVERIDRRRVVGIVDERARVGEFGVDVLLHQRVQLVVGQPVQVELVDEGAR